MNGWTILNRAYVGEHTDIFLSPSKKGYDCYERTVISPVFLPFVDADLSSYEGFLKLIDITGLTGFAYLDEDVNYKYPLGDELKKTSLSKGYIELFYNRHKNTLQNEQASVRLFHQWFIEGNQPLINNLHPDFIDDLKIHLSRVTLEPIFNPAPILDKVSETIMKVGFREILSGDKKKLSKCVESLTPSALRKASRKSVSTIRNCSTLPALCYLEMIDLIDYDAELRKCSHCGKLFVPAHDSEIFCNRLAPEFQPQGRLTTAEVWKSVSKKSCKKIGPQNKFNKSLSPEDRERIKQDKRFRSRLDYLKKIGSDDEYKKELRKFNKWKKEGGSAHGKKTR